MEILVKSYLIKSSQIAVMFQPETIFVHLDKMWLIDFNGMSITLVLFCAKTFRELHSLKINIHIFYVVVH